MSPVRSATNPYPISPRTYGGNGNGSPYGPPQRNMTAPMPMSSFNAPGPSPSGPFDHARKISEDSSYSSYFELPATPSTSQRGAGAGVGGSVAPPRQPSYGSMSNAASGTGSHGGGAWNGDLEAQRGRY